MATRKIIRRKVEEEELEDVEEDADELDDEEEVEVTKPAKKAPAVTRKSKAIEPEDDDDDDDDLDDDLDDDEPVAKPVKKVVATTSKKAVAAPPAKAVKTKKVAEPEEDEDEAPAKPVKVKSVATQTNDNLVTSILEALEVGKSIVITKAEDGKYVLADTKAVKAAKTKNMSWGEYEDTVLSQEYKDWREEWRQLTYDEQVARAKKLKAKWEEHDDPRINRMRVMESVTSKLGIEKYLPKYQDQAARKALRRGG